MNNNLLKGSDIAKILGVSKSYAYLLMRRGEIRTVKLGPKCVRVKPDDLESFLAENTAPHKIVYETN